MGVCGNVCCVTVVVINSGFLRVGLLKYVVRLCSGCDICCVSVCIVRHVAVGVRIWEV